MLRGLIAALALVTSFAAQAQTYPDRPVKIIVPYPAGGTTDILARVIADKLSKKLGQNFVVENRSGASGSIGTQAVHQSPPDGYTLLMGTVNTHGINSSVFKQLAYDPQKDFMPITMVGATPNVLMVHASLGVNSVADLIKLAKAQPGKVDFGSTSVGASTHMSGELLKALTDININHVPYRGAGPMLNDLIAGHIKVGVDNLPSSIGHIRAGTVKALAVTTTQRFPSLTDVPTMVEAGVPGYEVSAWFGLFAPAKTPQAIVDRLHQNVVASLGEDDVKTRLLELGAVPSPMSQQAFGDVVKREVEKWPPVVQKTGVKVE
ncbi:tripartite tricarboxylate transporter family receptor [Variibacter gotjawalensis]|uniref:Tripartite tricarboxylate transporter family receptor n=1 Tax=Variibacter gotjawalensis TaxID=1333996 RepID=A0A0S3PZM7_9BRAD|nr:tripartite tricarboxylate transporter substrate binding protein [Variibacter gotjawalensis]NIK47235.1 tripartite-type tricarboxylate transporter receptor subunit TctC [Variibacter gotjawalensis]RZS49135.1 tripartite-type tricarboxylate transporter receptor subunit TctC [Variibacter gotjawalensis]BAT61397.1 tripartite tricarboxylate transporter family receptor [Variibacter gotjawalensis]